jgi:uncharacterized membrane protein YvbJ
MSMVYCRGCGHQIEEVAHFCSKCGAPQNLSTGSQNSSSSAQPTSAPQASSTSQAPNPASYYANKPNSQCGRLVDSVLNGDQRAIEELKTKPEYCDWTQEKNYN